MSNVTLPALTSGTIAGSGTFETLMRAYKAFIDKEFADGRIKGPEYATVLLGSLESAGQLAVEFLLKSEKTAAEIALLEQQRLNAVQEELVLKAQECKLRAEYDVLKSTDLKTKEETALLTWKTQTEKAQTLALGVDDNSVIGKQKLLYTAQTQGFARDAEQKAAKIMIDTWNVRRTTDEGTVADGTNQLADTFVGRTVAKMMEGVGA